MLTVGLNEFAIGIGFGWISPMVKKFLEDPHSEIVATVEECSWIASMTEFGRTFGPIFSIILLDTLGRKLMLQIAAVTFLIMWMIILMTHSVLLICIALFAFGLSVGICNGISGVYIGENCSPKIRGILCSASVTCFYLALLIEFILAIYLPYHLVSIVSLIMVMCCLVSTLLLVESPQFLIMKERFEEAEGQLMWLRGTDNRDDVASEYENIKINIASEKAKKTSYWKLFTTPANYKSLIIVLILNMTHAASGNIVIFSYVSIILPSNEFFNSDELTIFFGIIQLIACFIGSLVSEKFNRRALTLFSFALFIVCHSLAAFLYYCQDNGSPVPYSSWIIFFLVCTYSGFSAIVDCVLHMIRGELFPQSIKPFGSSMSITAHSLFGFLTVKIFLMLKGQHGIYMNFILYAVVSLAAFCFSYFALPETRGKTLIDIQRSLEHKRN